MELPKKLYRCPHCKGFEVYGNNHPQTLVREGSEETYDALSRQYEGKIVDKFCSSCFSLRQ